MRLLFTAYLFLLPAVLFSQQPVSINVDAAQKLGAFQPIWSYFGYDEPNYTYAKNGKKLIGELSDVITSQIRREGQFTITTEVAFLTATKA